MAELNEEQRQAVECTEGCVRVIAGAGSGKTRALTHRFAYLVNELGILPGNILCVTFTNKAANEMRQRVQALTGDNSAAYINTFHGFCVAVLQEDSHAVHYPKSFLVLDNNDIDDMLRQIYEERGLTLRDMTFGDARDMFEIRKLFKDPRYYLEMIEKPVEELKEKYENSTAVEDMLFYGYLYMERKCFGLDYNDLLLFTLYIFEQQPDIRQKWQERLEYILADEFQDIDEPQNRLMEVLSGYHGNLFVVGDPDQTIYSWRGADGRYLMDFDKTHPGTRTVMMMKNYRSTPEILDAANSLIRRNRDRIEKDLVPVLPSGGRVRCHMAPDTVAEAERIAAEIRELQSRGVAPKDITLLYRAHYVTRTVEEVFRKREIPYALYSGVPFYARQEIKDALSYLRMAVYKDDLSFLRIANKPKRNLGERRMAFLKEYAAAQGVSLYDALRQNLEEPLFKGTGAAKFVQLIEEHAPLAEAGGALDLLNALLNRSGYETMLRTEGSQERLDNLAELKQAVFEFETTCGEEATAGDFLRRVALFTGSDEEQRGDKVRMMTVHAAKGLEFPYVFLLQMNEGVFPSARTGTRKAMEEERRLAFVAMTRAEKGLFLSCALGFNFDRSPRYPSRFLLDIDEGLLGFDPPPEESLLKDARAYAALRERSMPEELQKAALAPGTRVRHSVFGEGTVQAADEKKQAHIVQFDDLPTPRALSFKAKLEIL